MDVSPTCTIFQNTTANNIDSLSRTGAGYTTGEIAWWMLDIWFGLDASGFQNACTWSLWQV